MPVPSTPSGPTVSMGTIFNSAGVEVKRPRVAFGPDNLAAHDVCDLVNGASGTTLSIAPSEFEPRLVPDRISDSNGHLNITPGMEIPMNDESFNISLRKFLKLVGVSSQREIEQAVAKAIADGAISGTESMPAAMTLEIPALKLSVKFDGKIELE